MSVTSQPGAPIQNCYVSSGNASGAIGGGDVVVDIACETTPFYVGVTLDSPPQYTGPCTSITLTDGNSTWNLTSTQLQPYGGPNETYWFTTEYPSNGSFSVSYSGDTDPGVINCGCYIASTGNYVSNPGTLGTGQINAANQLITVYCYTTSSSSK